MKLPAVLRILTSPTALSQPVLLLQTPLALALGLGIRTPGLNQDLLLRLCFAASFMVGATAVFWLANVALRRNDFLQRRTALVVFAAWLATGLSSVLISQLIHIVTKGEQIPLNTRLLFVPLMWFASFLSIAHVLESRHRYVIKFQQLRQTNAALAEIEESAQTALQAERAQLIEAVRKTIKPELKLISSEIRAIELHTQEQHLGRILKQIDDYSILTLRHLIAELNADADRDTSAPHNPVLTAVPRLSLRNLPLDPVRSLRIAVGIGVTLLLPLVGFKVGALWLVQMLAVFTPLFAVQALRRHLGQLSRVPEITWVILACACVIMLRIFGIDVLPQIEEVTDSRFLTLVSAGYLAVSIVLGGLDKYFVDEYTHAAQQQESANFELAENLKRIDIARQLARRDLSRLLHGPIQGRLAAVRMKLHIATETSQSVVAALDQQDITQIAEMIDHITHDIETLAEPLEHKVSANATAEMDVLVANWQGLMDVVFKMPSGVSLVLDQDSLLAQKVVATCAEAITNASRHGNAKRIDISFDLDGAANTLSLTTVDNGRGTKDIVVPGIGLHDIEADGGKWRFEPIQTGARFRVDFPIDAAKPENAMGY